jgi:hypothetical protein
MNPRMCCIDAVRNSIAGPAAEEVAAHRSNDITMMRK